MTFSFGPGASALAAIAALAASLPLAAPTAEAQGRMSNGPKVCFANGSGQDLYFKAMYSSVVGGGSKLSSGSQFCSSNKIPLSVRVSMERKSGTLCSAQVEVGYTYTLYAPPTNGNCEWSVTAN